MIVTREDLTASFSPSPRSEMSGRILRKRRERKAAKNEAAARKAEAYAQATESAAKREEAKLKIAEVLAEAKASSDQKAVAEAAAVEAEHSAIAAATGQKTTLIVGGLVVAGIALFLVLK